MPSTASRCLMFLCTLTLSACGLYGGGPAEAPPAGPRLAIASEYHSAHTAGGVEMVSVQAESARAAALYAAGAIEILAIQANGALQHQRTISINLAPGEQVSSVAFHPTMDVVAVAIAAADIWASGRVGLYNPSNGRPLQSVPVGVGPGSLAFSKNGRYLLVANEAEGYIEKADGFVSPEGSVTRIEFHSKHVLEVKHLDIAGLAQAPGLTAASAKRLLTREVAGEDVEILLTADAQHLEPEHIAISPDSTISYVTLQENDAVLVIDNGSATIKALWGLGVSNSQKADKASLDQALLTHREADGIAVTPDGRYVLTADEGATAPQQGERQSNEGRTLSIFDAEAGLLVADTGDQLHAKARDSGVYREPFSDQAGVKPESVAAFLFHEHPYAVVSLGNVGALALIDLQYITQPQVLQVLSLSPAPYELSKLALFEGGNTHIFLFAANKGDGLITTVSVK